jgi:protein-tyrosine-phosphatase
MAAALLDAAAGERGITGLEIGSAGVMPGGVPAAEGARTTVDGLDDHISHQISAPLIRYTDLVIGMTRSHVREVTVLAPETFSYTFTLKELVRIAPLRAHDESLESWVRRLAGGRQPWQLKGESDADDIGDPIGRPLTDFAGTVAEMRPLIWQLVDLAWPRELQVAS